MLWLTLLNTAKDQAGREQIEQDLLEPPLVFSDAPEDDPFADTEFAGFKPAWK